MRLLHNLRLAGKQFPSRDRHRRAREQFHQRYRTLLTADDHGPRCPPFLRGLVELQRMRRIPCKDVAQPLVRWSQDYS